MASKTTHRCRPGLVLGPVAIPTSSNSSRSIGLKSLSLAHRDRRLETAGSETKFARHAPTQPSPEIGGGLYSSMTLRMLPPTACGGRIGGGRQKSDEPHAPIVYETCPPRSPSQPPARVLYPGGWEGEWAGKVFKQRMNPMHPSFFNAQGARDGPSGAQNMINSAKFHSSFSRIFSLGFPYYSWAEANFGAIRPPSHHVLGLQGDLAISPGCVWPLFETEFP